MKKNIIIAGATGGIGSTIVKTLSSDNGYNLLILGRSEEKLSLLAKECACEYYQIDITNILDIKKFEKYLIQNNRSIDCLISCVGQYCEGEIDVTSYTDIAKVYSTNVIGNTYLIKSVIPVMKKQKSGQIIYINSGMGLKSHEDKSIYSASKWAMTGLMKCLELELSKYGIRVCTIYPNKVKTDIFSSNGINMDLSNALQPTELIKIIELYLNLDSNTVITDISIKHLKHSLSAKYKKIPLNNTYILKRI